MFYVRSLSNRDTRRCVKSRAGYRSFGRSSQSPLAETGNSLSSSTLEHARQCRIGRRNVAYGRRLSCPMAATSVSSSSLPDSSDSEASSCCDILDSCTADRGVGRPNAERCVCGKPERGGAPGRIGNTQQTTASCRGCPRWSASACARRPSALSGARREARDETAKHTRS